MGARFIGVGCEVTVSCLPDFAQPSRLVNTSPVPTGFDGEVTRPQVKRWRRLMAADWKRSAEPLPLLIRTVGSAFGRSPRHYLTHRIKRPWPGTPPWAGFRKP